MSPRPLPRRSRGLDGSGDEKTVDCRPSDAIALAVQVGAPIFVARDVFDVVAPQ